MLSGTSCSGGARLAGGRPRGRCAPAPCAAASSKHPGASTHTSHITQVTTTSPRPGTPRPGFSWGHRTSACTIHMFVGGCSIYIFCVRVKKPRGPRPAGPVPPDEDGHTRQQTETHMATPRGRTPLAGPTGRYPVRRQAVRCRLSPGHRTPRFPAARGAKLLDRGAARARRKSTAHAARRAPARARRMRRAGAGEGGPRPRPPPRPAPARRAKKSTARAPSSEAAQPARQPSTRAIQHKSQLGPFFNFF